MLAKEEWSVLATITESFLCPGVGARTEGQSYYLENSELKELASACKRLFGSENLISLQFSSC